VCQCKKTRKLRFGTSSSSATCQLRKEYARNRGEISGNEDAALKHHSDAVSELTRVQKIDKEAKRRRTFKSHRGAPAKGQCKWSGEGDFYRDSVAKHYVKRRALMKSGAQPVLRDGEDLVTR